MFLTAIILIITYGIYVDQTGKILHKNRLSGPTKLMTNFQDFLRPFKTKKCFSIFLPINHPDLTISMGKKSTSL